MSLPVVQIQIQLSNLWGGNTSNPYSSTELISEILNFARSCRIVECRLQNGTNLKVIFYLYHNDTVSYFITMASHDEFFFQALYFILFFCIAMYHQCELRHTDKDRVEVVEAACTLSALPKQIFEPDGQGQRATHGMCRYRRKWIYSLQHHVAVDGRRAAGGYFAICVWCSDIQVLSQRLHATTSKHRHFLCSIAHFNVYMPFPKPGTIQI